MLESIFIITSILAAVVVVAKFLVDAINFYINKRLDILEKTIKFEFERSSMNRTHCQEILAKEFSSLSSRLAKIERFLDAHELLDFSLDESDGDTSTGFSSKKKSDDFFRKLRQ